jgi:uncharacterized protein YicC (UPF0701 family)
LLGSLKSLSDRVRQEMPEAGPLSVNDVLRWPGMFGDQSVDFAALGPVVLALAREAIDDFTATRGREGEKLAAMIVDRVNAMREIVRQVAPRIPEAQAVVHRQAAPATAPKRWAMPAMTAFCRKLPFLRRGSMWRKRSAA